MPAYQYEPLSSAPDSIRLLLLQPSDARDAGLKGSLLNTTLKLCDYDLIDTYTALSYVWGSGEKPCQILLDNKAFAITRSLKDALRDMRDATRVRRIWADAICINQEDVPERNEQVLIMKDVYSTANSTVIYLGGSTKELDAVFKAGPPDKQLDDTFQYDVARRIVELARADILARPWFTRVWVLQELVFSKDPWVQCSTKRMRWTDLERLFYYSEPERSRTDSVMHNMSNFRKHERGSHDLRSILESRRGCGAQDPRDLVYANISVSSDSDIANRLKVDYNDSLLQVYTKAALHVYSSRKFDPTAFISQVDDVPAEKRVPGLPSWATDWRLRPPSLCRLQSRSFSRHDQPSFILDLGLAVFRGTLHAFTGGNLPPVLGHIGFKIGVIESISGIIPKKGSLQNPPPSAKDFQQIYEKFEELSRSSIEACDEAFDQQLKHCEGEHEECCDILSDSWTRWFENLDEKPQLEEPGSKDFVSHFCQWLLLELTQIAKIRREKYVTRFAFSSMLECLQGYCDYREDRGYQYGLIESRGEECEGRRLAFTQDGSCGLVPSQARKSDVVGLLAQADVPAIFRPKKTDGDSEIGEAIVQALRQEELCRIHVNKWSEDTRRREPSILWEFPTEGTVDVEDYSIIGECIFEGWSSLEEQHFPEIEEDIRVFALH